MPSVPTPPAVLLALAARLRTRLGELTRLGRTTGQNGPEAQQHDAVIVSAVSAFAPTAYARARLLRQLHACGLLDERETRAAAQLAAPPEADMFGVPKAG